MARPLTKRKRTGESYTRPPDIQRRIDRALGATSEQVLLCAQITDQTSADYVPSECLVHLIRDARRCDDQLRVNTLLSLLLSRCELVLFAKIPDGRLKCASDVREEVLGRLSELFAIDNSIQDHHALDFYEVRFNRAFSKLRIDVLREEKRKVVVVPLPDHDDEGESLADDARFARLSAALSVPATQEMAVLKQELHDAIDALPEDERRAVILRFLMEYDIESEDPMKPTVATLCGVSGRTIRGRLTRARAKLAEYLEDEK